MIYGYARVSSADQNEVRQLAALREAGVKERNLYRDKLSGKDWRQENLVSLAGVYLPKEKIEDSTTPAAVIKYLAERLDIQKIHIHFDNDNAGRKATQALKVILPKRYEIFDEPPKKGKDYNDYLCIQLGIWKSKERNFER